MRSIHKFNNIYGSSLGFENNIRVSVYGNPMPQPIWSFFKIEPDGLYRYTGIVDPVIDSDRGGVLKILGVDLI